MPNLFGINGDLDNVFEPLGILTKRADVGILSGTTDISNLYAPVANGSAASATGIYSGSTDVASLFAAKGSVAYIATPWNGNIYLATFGSAATTNDVAATFYLFSDGTYQIQRTNAAIISGTWLSAGSTSQYQVRFTVINTTSSTDEFSPSTTSLTNGASTYSAITTNRSIQVLAQAVSGGGSSFAGEAQIYANIRVEFRRAADSVVVSTSTIQLEAAAQAAGGGSGVV